MSKGFLYEMHLHTCDISRCGVSSAKEHVRAHYEKGFSGFVVTDHFFNGNCAIHQELDWETRVNAFCQGYESAKAEAENLDFDVLFGFEYGYLGTDFLTYGIGKDFLLAHPDMLHWTPEYYFDRVHEAGGFIIHAHPFREASYIAEIRLFTNYIDAVEVENRANGDSTVAVNKKAYAYAKEHNFPMTKGSDIHDASKIHGGGMYFEQRPKDIFDLIEMIKTRQY